MIKRSYASNWLPLSQRRGRGFRAMGVGMLYPLIAVVVTMAAIALAFYVLLGGKH